MSNHLRRFMTRLSAVALVGLLIASVPGTAGARVVSDEAPVLVPASRETQQQAEGQQAQTQQQTEEGAALVQPPAGPPMEITAEEAAAVQLVEQILREEEGVLMGQDLSYDPSGRRDPFRSLLATATSQLAAPATRPHGLAGFLINEIELKAIAQAQGKYRVMLIGPDQRAYFGEVGTQLFDGHIVEIRPGEVQFEQVIPDLMGARRTRQVTKTLRSTGGSELPQP
jgi:hypothetical protein